MADPSKFLEINNNDDGLTTAKKINSNFKKLLDNSIATKKKVLSIDGLSQMAKDTAEQAHSVSSDALLTAISAETIANEVSAQHRFDLRIYSSHGFIFKNGQGSTTLSAVLYDREDIVTDTYDTECFHWIRASNDEAGDAAWNAENFGGTKSVLVTGADVYVSATFTCTFTSPEGDEASAST